MAETKEPVSHCGLFITRKNRYCKMVPNPGEIYCNQHLPINVQLPNGKKRIVCPLDSKHSCYEDDLQDHLLRCNARKRPQPIYYKEDINSGSDFLTDSSNDTVILKVPIKDVPTDKLLSILAKIDQSYAETVDSVADPFFISKTSNKEISEDKNLFNLKHTKQNASLLNLLKNYDLIRDGMTVVELGAGRGGLTHWIIQETKPTEKSLFLLIDRASQRHKFDNKLKGMNGIRIERIKIDIQHLDIKMVPFLHTCEEMVILSKHLCGSATDFALRCLTNYHSAYHNSKDTMSKFKGILIALCCHHRCEWKHYVGKEFMKRCGFCEDDFNILLSISSWATCGTRSHKTPAEPNPIETKNDKLKLGLTESEQTSYGLKSKRLIDQGRMDYLKKYHFTTELVYYTDQGTSLENVALLTI